MAELEDLAAGDGGGVHVDAFDDLQNGGDVVGMRHHDELVTALVGGDAGIAVKVTLEGSLGEVLELALHILRLNEIEFDELNFLAELLGLVEAEEHGFHALQVEEGVTHQKGIGFVKRHQMGLV